MRKYILYGVLLLAIGSCSQKDIHKGDDFVVIQNKYGAALGYCPESGVTILTEEGLYFKDLNKNGTLEPYEDWRLSPGARARDLASRLSVEEIAGLMLYSNHQAVPAQGTGYLAGTYNGKSYKESGAEAWDLTDDQKRFLREDHVRHILITHVESPEVAARWNNNIQAYLEGIGWGIPGNTSSDPRHSWQSADNAEFNVGGGGHISVWPDSLAMAATFEPAIARQFGEVAAREYRALGITTALSPQIDLGSDPRWYQIGMTFGEDPRLATDMARAYIDGMQTSEGEKEIENGWGYESVNAMVKHWPGGGTGEGGRDAHWAYGKFGVYPGDNFEMQLQPFIYGAFRLDGPTTQASAVMPYYTISYDQAPDGTNVGNGFSHYIITDLLREKYEYDGVVCTDWGITADEGETPDIFAGKPWGVEKLSVEERHYLALMAGVDQFGGNNDMKPILAAYQIGEKEYGEDYMRTRFEASAIRLLKNMFQVGLFENPYLDPGVSGELVGNEEFIRQGYEAQLRSVVLLKNKDVLPLGKKRKIYIPKIYFASVKDWWGVASQARTDYPVNRDLAEEYFDLTDDPEEAEAAIVFITSPDSDTGGYSIEDRWTGGNGYIPITLQYGTYKAVHARVHSIAAGDPVVDSLVTDRSYRGKEVTPANTRDLTTVQDTRTVMGGKPIIVVVNASKPLVVSEFEPEVDGLVIRFGVSDQAVFDILTGAFEPTGLLPVQFPADMQTVEEQAEDIPHDMRPHMDSRGNSYDFGFGLNWSGVIEDERTARYKR